MIKGFKDFCLPSDIESHLSELREMSDIEIAKKSFQYCTEFSKNTHQNVPAYGQFLTTKGVKTVSPKIFKSLPCMNKGNYLQTYGLDQLMYSSDLNQMNTFSSSSGSSGKWTYFPRGKQQDKQYEYITEMFLNNQFNIKHKRTLAIIGFGMGIWIAGIFTYKILNCISEKGYPLSIAPVGPDKKTFIDVVTQMGDYFDQILFIGYPPVIMDIIDAATYEGIRLKKFNIKVITAAESFSEDFRDSLVKKLGIKNSYTDVLNIYGSADLGAMAHETPLAVYIRKQALENKALFQALFPNVKTVPTLAQYYPYLTYFEEDEGDLIATGYGSGIPLVRYQLHDRGGVHSYTDIKTIFKSFNIDLDKAISDLSLSHTVLKLPFVYVYERSDFAFMYKGINIYPMYIKKGLSDNRINQFVTGKFTTIKKQLSKKKDSVTIHVELKKGCLPTGSLHKAVSKSVIDNLRQQSNEFDSLSKSDFFDKGPGIKLHAYEDNAIFGGGTKHQWLKVI